MQWQKLGIVYKPDGANSWAKTHASVPTPFMLNDNVIRVYLTFRDEHNVGRAGFVELSAENPLQVLNVSSKPALDIGLPGTFDESGVMPTCIVSVADDIMYMYYVGFELGTKIRYRLLTGLAVSRDRGNTFERLQTTPILERSDKELFFRGGPFVLLERGIFKLWYVAGSNWTNIGGKELPVYALKYLESADGITWAKVGEACLDLTDPDEHGFGRPYVIREMNHYELFYSIRKRSLGAYRLGYATSPDGIHWNRKDSELGLDVSAAGWDSEAIMYSAVIKVRDHTFLFYNGNNFGGTGFGVAVLQEP